MKTDTTKRKWKLAHDTVMKDMQIKWDDDEL
jgi:hypothetical protein